MTDRVNRAVLFLFSVLLIAVGILLLLARAGTIEVADPSNYYGNAQANIAGNSGLALAITIAIGVVLTLGCVWVLFKQAVPGRPKHPSALSVSTEHGVTRLDARAIEAAMEHEIANAPGVEDAAVMLQRSGRRPTYRSRVEIGVGCELSAVVSHLEAAEKRVCKNLDLDDIDGSMRITLGSKDKARVE